MFPDLEEDYVTSATPEKIEDSTQDQVEEIEEEELEEEVEEEGSDEQQQLDSLEDELKEELRRRREERGGGQPRGEQAPALDPSGARASQRRRPVTQRKPATDVGEAISNIYGTVRELMEDEYAEQYDDEQGLVDLNEVEDLLQQLQVGRREVGGRIPVREQIMDGAIVDGRRRRLAPEAAQSIEVVESLVDTIEGDNLLSEGVKDWVRQLELTLDKVATKQSDFLSQSNPHRSMEVINQLAKLGGAETGSVKRHVDSIIDDINDGYDSNPEISNEAYEKLQPLVERQNRTFTGNVQRTVKASEGQQILQNAQRAVISEMDSRLSGKEVPEILMKLLMPGWRNLMVNTHLRQGEDSGDWRKHVQAMEQLLMHLDEGADPTESEDYMPPEELLSHIESGLDSISYEPGQRVQLVNSLREILTSEEGASGLPTVELDSVAETLGLGDVGDKETTRHKILLEKSDHAQWSKYRERAMLLHVGEWVEFLDATGAPEIGIVAWVSEDSTQLVFVNRRGVKTHELSVEELATMLADGTARILEESDIPLTDRASHAMLQRMHNDLTHQATHDELTGLVNRKEFERELEVALDDAKRSHNTHVAAYFDLDQFKVINNTGGHDAGDQLLIEMSEELTKIIDSAVTLSRLGGHEYGVLISNSDSDAGEAVLKNICEAVKNFRFTWESEQFSLTASCGGAAGR